MRLTLQIVAGVMLSVATPADACSSEPMPEAVIFDRKPANKPAGYSYFRVIGKVEDAGRERLLVKIIEPIQARTIGNHAWIEPAQLTSCLTWGRVGSEGYVVAKPAGRLNRRVLLIAKTYRRSWWDALWSYFGQSRFTPTGNPVEG